MEVIKRNGNTEKIRFDKITERIKKLIYKNEKDHLDAAKITMKLIQGNYIIKGCKTSDIDSWTAEICGHESVMEPRYNQLGGRICVSNLHKKTGKEEKKENRQCFSDIMTQCFKHVNRLKEQQPLINKQFYDFVQKHKKLFNQWIDYKTDYNFDYFAFKTLEKNYLLKTDNGDIIESPQDLFMRVAIALNMNDVNNNVCNIDFIRETYNCFKNKQYTHATPTLFNAGTHLQQMSSCFLVSVQDSLSDIYSGLNECAMISKNSGGIGIEIHDIRAKNSTIRSTNGKSSGIVPMLKVFEATARYVNQGGKRKGSIAVYLADYHADIEDFLDLRKNVGAESERARDLFLAVWLSDLFMKRVKNNQLWSLMCPDECRGLADLYGDDFEKLYTQYEEKKMFRKQLPARKIWEKIKISLIETGSPYVHFKDHINHKSNQKNIGVIRTSNLCSEIMEVTNKNESAVCNLASIALSQFVKFNLKSFKKDVVIFTMNTCKPCSALKQLLEYHNIKFTEFSYNSNQHKQFKQKYDIHTVPQICINDKHIGGYNEILQLLSPYFDLDDLYKTTKITTRNLNKVIDINFYPTNKTKHSNILHRPIGIGVQGLADVYAMMRYPFDSKEAISLNKKIFETIYFASVEASCDIAMEREMLLQNIVPIYNKKNKTHIELKQLQDFMKQHNVIHSELNRDSHFGAYSSFIGSPFSKGLFQFDLWGKKWVNSKQFNSSFKNNPNVFTSKWNWNHLRKRVIKYGTRNSLLTSLMPTASTSQILGNNECFEPFTNNIYTRKTIAGMFRVVNKYLIRDLQRENIWNDHIKNLIILNKGSIQNITQIPSHIRSLHKTVWEIKQKVLIQQAADRAPFIDQSQSMNLFFSDPSKINKMIDSALFMGWTLGLKTGLYYLRTKPATDAIQFTIDKSKFNSVPINDDTNDDHDICLTCSA